MSISSPTQQKLSGRQDTNLTEKQQASVSIFKNLAQSFKKLALYLHQEEGLENYFSVPASEMQAYHEKFKEDLTIQIKPFDFLLNGETIYHDDGQESSITYKLYKVGIRTFTFEEEITSKDLAKLGKILIKSPMDLAQEDIASLLWQADIPHLSYLQIQSVAGDGDGEGSEKDNEIFEQLMLHVEAQLQSDDPRNQIHYRSILTSDLNTNEIFSTVDSQRQITQQQSPLKEEETEAIQKLLKKERYELAAKGSELLYFLLKNIEDPKELERIEEHVLILGEHLSMSYDFYHLAMLLEEIIEVGKEIHENIQERYEEIQEKIYQRLATPEHISNIIQYLEETTRLTLAERNDIRIYLTLFNERIHEQLLDNIHNVTSPTRRILLSVFAHSKIGASIIAELLKETQKKKEFIIDILMTAKEMPKILTTRQLQTLLQHKELRIQTEALLVLAQNYPQHIPATAQMYLQDANPELQRIALEVLCRSGNRGVVVVIEYLESKYFKKLKWSDKEDLYRLLGQTHQPKLLAYFSKMLQKKSHFLAFNTENKKKLAIIGLISSGKADDREYLEAQLKMKNHSKTIKKELETALNRFSY